MTESKAPEAVPCPADTLPEHPGTPREGETAANARPRAARQVLLVSFLFVIFATRFLTLGERPLHHDESIHAYQSYTLAKDGNWKYDPAYHGPFLYYANALVYRLVGATDATARLLPAIFGVLLIGFAWPLSRWIGKEAAVAYAVLVTISPHFNYFSRFIREDLYSLVFTIGTIVAFRLFLERDRARWLTASAILFAFAGVTKENAYMTGVLFVAFGLWVFFERVTREKPIAAAIQTTAKATAGWVSRHFLPLLTAALVFLSLWAIWYTAFGRHPGDWLAIPKAVKYWMGQHTIARIPGPWWYYLPQIAYYETGFLLAAAFAFTRREWRHDPFLRSLLLVAPVFLVLLTWTLLKQDMTSRPVIWLVFAWLVSLLIPLIAPRVSGPPEVDRPPLPPFVRFLTFWTAASFAIYSWAREKVPWLTVHPLLPITILAAIGIANLWRDRREKGVRRALAVVCALLAVNASGMLLACFRYGAPDKEKEPKHNEMLAYVQTTYELVRSLDPLKKARERVPAGEPLITISGEATWPLTWYLRDVPTRWVSQIREVNTPMVVADWDAEGGLEKQLTERYNAKRVPIRAWWFPERTAGTAEDPTRHPTIGESLNFWLFHEVWSLIGSQDTVVYVRKDLEGSGPLQPIQVVVQDTSVHDYPSAASSIPPDRRWGAAGAGPGELAEPRGLAADSRGNLYVADTKNNRIQVFDGSGRFLRQFGSKGPGEGQVNEPCGIALDQQGEVWVADTWNNRIEHFTSEGKFVSAFGDPDKTFFGPRALVVSHGFLYVADTGNKRIVRFDLDGNRISEWGGAGAGAGQLIEPVGLAADPAGNIYVADTGNHRVQVFNLEGKFVRQFPVPGWKDFYTEPHIVIGPSDTVFVTDSSNSRVAQYDSSGTLRRSWRPEDDFKQPTGITLDPFGRLTVSDRGTHRLFSWPLTALLP